MSIVAIIAIVAICLFLGFVLVSISRSNKDETTEKVQAWERALAEESSAVGRILYAVARPVSRLDALYEGVPSKHRRYLQSKLLAGGAFGGDVDIFLAVQVATVLLGFALLAMGFAEHGPLRIVFALLGSLIPAYPWNIVSKRAKAKAGAVTEALPAFAELLQMSVAGGMGLESALSFTAERVSGPVSDEVRNMLLVRRSNPGNEEAAYLLAGERLGTAEAKAFFRSLLQAELEGAKILDSLASQAKSLREHAFQVQRAEVKKLPVSLVVMFGIHLLPFLFIVALYPTLVSLSGL